MKKVSALLLTGIIGSSMLFASFSGTATVTNTLVDFNSGNTFGFANSTELDATIDLYASTAEMMGEGDVYAEINASLNIPVTLDESEDGAIWDLVTDDINIAFDSANIVGEGWKVSILGVDGTYDYAADTIALDGDDEAYNYSIAGADAPGVAVTLDNLGTVSVGYTGDFDDLTATKGYVALEAAEMEVSEGMTAQVAASLAIDKTLANKVEVAGSAKLAYASDDYSASVALDAGYDANNFGMDVVMNSTSKYATVDAYFGTFNTNGDFNDDPTDLADIAASNKMLNVKAVSDLANFDVPVTLTLTGLDLINIQDLDGKVEYALTDELAPYVMGGYVINTKAWNVGGGLTYTVDAYTATAEVAYNSDKELSASASVESTTLVDGATLTLEWADADDLLKKTASDDFGAVTASCSIEF
ncbi:MAG: hypothetical protein PQJ45_07210 [Sphaerochaetaceae bacterium]|nr:hypothetical protein [Sphaerochaetaceae bacterium]